MCGWGGGKEPARLMGGRPGDKSLSESFLSPWKDKLFSSRFVGAVDGGFLGETVGGRFWRAAALKDERAAEALEELIEEDENSMPAAIIGVNSSSMVIH